MQVNQPISGSAEASTSQANTRVRPPLAGNRLELPSICDICGKARSTRKHAKCSRIRQQSKNQAWASYINNVAAKKTQRNARNSMVGGSHD